MRCSLRTWALLGSLALLFLTSLLFSLSLRGGAGLPYLDPPGWEDTHRVKLVPSYTGSHRLGNAGGAVPRTCACRSCVGDPGVSEWFDESFDPDISPVWTRENMQLPPDVYYWWVVSVPCSSPPLLFLGTGLVGLLVMRAGLFPESLCVAGMREAASLPLFVLVPFKTLDLLWITSALSTGQIRFTYAPVKQFLRVDKDKVQIYNPAFFKYIHDRWTQHHGRYPSTGMLVLFFALHVCDEVNVFGFGADSRGNWHHYWEQNRYAGEFRKTGVHDADYEAQIISSLAKAGKITIFPGK
nr:PREDICTED: CMP-N-acetylneuraminate-beta-galactosamide-alpha-2,3-sialyltransferase 2 [Lepisosteus oculatus]